MRSPMRLIVAILAGVAVIGFVVWLVISPSDKDTSEDASPEAGEASLPADETSDTDRSLTEGLAEELFGSILNSADQQRAAQSCDPEVVGRDVTAFSVCAASGELISTDHSSLGAQATWLMDTDLVSAASGVLEEYRDSSLVTLSYDGYIDLFRNVWGCVVEARSGWVEIVVVSDRDDSSDSVSATSEGSDTCTVTVVRLDIGLGHERTSLEEDEAA